MSTPKETLIKAIKDHLLERMNVLGFTFFESQLKFKRKQGDFSQEIWFSGSKTNWADEFINFQYQFVIHNSKYKKFIKELGEKIYSSSGLVQGNRELLKSWDRSKETGFGYDFVKMDHKKIMDDIYRNVINTGLKYFESSNSNEKIAKSGQGTQKLDFKIIIGQYQEARAIYEEFSHKYSQMEEKDKLKHQHLMNQWNRRIKYIEQRNADTKNVQNDHSD